MYPTDWPKCPGCGEPALDGHITCGKIECDERAAREIREKYGPPKIHILNGGHALCGKPGVPGEWRDGHRWVRFEERATATCDECLSAAWPLVAERVPVKGDNPLDEMPPASAFSESTAELFAVHGRELLRALFAWRSQGPAVGRWATKPSRKLAHLADRIAQLYPEPTAKLRIAGRDDAIEDSLKRIRDLAARELQRMRDELAAIVGDLDAVTGAAHDAAEEAGELGSVQKDERPDGRKDEGTTGRIAFPRTRELLRRFAHDWRESEKDPANFGGKVNFDLLAEVCDAFEAEDRDE